MVVVGDLKFDVVLCFDGVGWVDGGLGWYVCWCYGVWG